MFKFLFGGKKAPSVKPETNRERFARLVEELNAMIDTLPTKPRVTLDPQTGHILPETPEQFADEALALPAPEPETAASNAREASAPEHPQADTPSHKTPKAEAAPAEKVAGGKTAEPADEAGKSKG